VRKNTIGVVHWEALRTGTDGEQIVLIVPAYFQSHHVPYLGGVLESRLSEFFNNDSVSFSLSPGELARTTTSTSYEPGNIVINGMTKPWPDAAALRATLDAAFLEAGEIEERQRQLADDLFQHLRSDSQR
jgi:hypothetical protein